MVKASLQPDVECSRFCTTASYLLGFGSSSQLTLYHSQEIWPNLKLQLTSLSLSSPDLKISSTNELSEAPEINSQPVSLIGASMGW